MARRSSPGPRRAGRPKRPLVSAACDASPVLNPVRRVFLNPVLAAGHPRGHPKTLRTRRPTRTSTRASSSWSTWTRRPLAENLALVRADQLTNMCSLVRADQKSPAETSVSVRTDQPTKMHSLVRADQETENQRRRLWSTWTSRGAGAPSLPVRYDTASPKLLA